MTIPVIGGQRLVSREDFLAGLTSRHPVSQEFIDAVSPTINAIFMNVPDNVRARMIQIAQDSFRRQSEAEEILRRTGAGLERLRRFNEQAGASRRKKAVAARRDASQAAARISRTG